MTHGLTVLVLAENPRSPRMRTSQQVKQRGDFDPIPAPRGQGSPCTGMIVSESLRHFSRSLTGRRDDACRRYVSPVRPTARVRGSPRARDSRLTARKAPVLRDAPPPAAGTGAGAHARREPPVRRLRAQRAPPTAPPSPSPPR